jgi:hypothetical protein
MNFIVCIHFSGKKKKGNMGLAVSFLFLKYIRFYLVSIILEIGVR